MARNAALAEKSDADLLDATRAGRPEAFGELFARHSAAATQFVRYLSAKLDADDVVAEAYTRIFSAVSGGKGPKDAFRPYLYATLRNVVRSWGAQDNPDTVDDFADTALINDTHLEAGLERSITVRAFKSLSPRWQSILWYTEVEELDPHEVAPLFGLSAGAAASLAHRAREALRDAWVQAHISDANRPPECARTVERLGRYTRGTLTAAEAKRVDDHLRECVACTAVAAEIDTISSRLHLVIVPLLLGAGGLGFVEFLRNTASAIPAGPASAAAASIAFEPVSSSSFGGSSASGGISSGSGAGVGAGAGAGAGAGVGAGTLGIVAAVAAIAVVGSVVIGGVMSTPSETVRDAPVETSAPREQLPTGEHEAEPTAPPVVEDEAPTVTEPSPVEQAPRPQPVSPERTADQRESAPRPVPSPRPTPTPTPTPPAPVITTPSAPVMSPVVATAASRPTLTGTGEPGLGITVVDDRGRTVGATTVAANGTWSVVATDDLAPTATRLDVVQRRATGETSPPASSPVTFVPVATEGAGGVQELWFDDGAGTAGLRIAFPFRIEAWAGTAVEVVMTHVVGGTRVALPAHHLTDFDIDYAFYPVDAGDYELQARYVDSEGRTSALTDPLTFTIP